MAESIRGINVVIGAETTGLQRALADVTRNARSIQQELRQVERLLQLDPSSTTLLAQRQQLLASAVENTRDKLARLRAAQEQVNAQFARGEISEGQYRAFQREIVQTEQELQRLETQLEQTGRASQTLATRMAAVGTTLQDVGRRMTAIGQQMTMAVTLPILAAGAASFKMAADLQDAMGAADQIFKDASGSVQDWASGLESYYGIAEGEALTYANTMGAMLQNIGGLSEAEAAKQAQILVELAGDLTAMFGGTTESAVQALTGALKGNNSMLDNYGMGVNEATIKTKAMEMGLIQEGEQLDLAGKQAATLALIMEQTADAQGQAARESEGASGALRSFTTELKNVGTELGEVLLPILTPMVLKLKEAVQAFGQLSPGTQTAIVAIAAIAAAIGPLLVMIGMMSTGIGSLLTAASAVAGALAGLSAPVVAAVAAIVAAFAILGVAIYQVWNENEELRNTVMAVWADIQDCIQRGVDAITGLWNVFGPHLTSVWDAVWASIKGVVSGALTIIANVLGLGLNIMTHDWEGAAKNLEGIWSGLWDVVVTIMNSTSAILQAAFDLLVAAVQAIWEAFTTELSSRWEAYKQSVVDTAEDLKSEVAAKFEALVSPVQSAWDSIKTAMQSPIQEAYSFITGIISDIEGAFASMSIQIPHFDLPHVSVGSSSTDVGGIPISYPTFDVSWWAQGGIFDRPSVIGVGEAGPEAVIPLDKLEGMGGTTVSINVASMTVRDDSDIRKIAKELNTMITNSKRGRGGAYVF